MFQLDFDLPFSLNQADYWHPGFNAMRCAFPVSPIADGADTAADCPAADWIR
jgi:hypothetical protein